MKLITKMSDVNIGDFIIFVGRNSDRVYKVLNKNNDRIFDRKPIYSSDGEFSNSNINDFDFKCSTFWHLLDEKEIHHYLKLVVFE